MMLGVVCSVCTYVEVTGEFGFPGIVYTQLVTLGPAKLISLGNVIDSWLPTGIVLEGVIDRVKLVCTSPAS